MNETILDIEENVEENVMLDTGFIQSDSEYGKNDLESDILNSGSDVIETNVNAVIETETDDLSAVTNVTYALEYNSELGGYPVVIVNDISEDISTLSLANGTRGYQVSDYWMNYFRGVLQKYSDTDYLAFATREYVSSGYNNYTNHYWLYIGDIENGGQITVYDCYSENSLYYVDVSTEYINGINIANYDTLAYSNLGHMSDLRTGVNHVETTALLFFLGFFAVYTVCRDFFNRVSRK